MLVGTRFWQALYMIGVQAVCTTVYARAGALDLETSWTFFIVALVRTLHPEETNVETQSVNNIVLFESL